MKLVLIGIVVFVTFNTTIFINSLPLWCANPNGKGNWVVQPLCK